MPAGQNVAGQQAQPGVDRQFVLLAIGLGQVSPVAAHVADQQVNNRDACFGDDFQRGGRGEDPAELEARAGVNGGWQIHEILQVMDEHEPPDKPDTEFAEWIRERRDAGRAAGLPGFGREGVRIVLRENQVHSVDQISAFERQVAVAVLEPAQVEIAVLGLCLPLMLCLRNERRHAMPMIRLRLAIEHAEHSHQIVQFVCHVVVGAALREEIPDDDALAELERLVRFVVPRQPLEALEHAAFEHVAARPVELGEGGFDVGGRQFGHVAFGDLVAPLFTCLGIHEGAQARFRQQVIPAAHVDDAHHSGFGFFALRILSGNGRSASTAVALIEHETREAEMRGLGKLLGFAEQIEGSAYALDDGDALVGEIGDADAGDERIRFHVSW